MLCQKTCVRSKGTMKYTYAYRTSDGVRHEARWAPLRAGGGVRLAAGARNSADCEAAKATKSDDELIAFWESMNDRLRNLGIKPIPLESLD